MKFCPAVASVFFIFATFISDGFGGYANAAEPSKNLSVVTRQAQSLLAALGYELGSADGKFGPRTRKAIETFEQDISQKKSGKVDYGLVSRLQKWVQLSAITELYLKAMGYDVGPINGVLDKKGRSAIRSFQKAQKLSLTERLSPNLFNAIWLQARNHPDATKFLCKHYSSNNSISRSLSWCKQAAKLGDNKAKAIATKLQHRISKHSKIPPSKRLFQKDFYTEREMKALRTSMKALSGANKLIDAMQMVLTYQAFQKGNCKRLEDVDAKATEGSAMHQYLIAELYRKGLCVEKNDVTAVKWLKLAAEQGLDTAQHDLAVYYRTGQGLKKDMAQAVRWYEAAGNQGHAESQFALGQIYEKGDGVIQDYRTAKTWYEKAAKRGHHKAIFFLGEIYREGKGVRKDYARAFEWYEISARYGFKLGQTMTAIYLLHGIGTARNLVQAHKWANLASTSKNSQIAKLSASTRSKAEKLMKPHEVASAQDLARKWKPESIQEPAPSKMLKAELPEIAAGTADPLSQEEAKAKLLALGVPINKDTLRQVITKDNLGVFKLFHRAGADLDTGLGTDRDLTPLYLSIDFGSRKIYRYLMDNAVDVNKRSRVSGMTPLVRAISHSRWDIVNELLDAGADASQSPESRSEKRGALIAGTALEYAASFWPNPVLISRLLDANAKTSERYLHQETPLHAALSNGHIENVRVLIQAGANLNAANKYGQKPIDKYTGNQNRPKIEILRLLLTNGASVKQKDQSTLSPLFWATYRGRADLIKLFVQFGADVNERYFLKDDQIPMGFSYDRTMTEVIKHGGTPLHIAAKKGHLSAAKELIRHNASKSIIVSGKSNKHSVVSLARQSGNTTLFQFLKGH